MKCRMWVNAIGNERNGVKKTCTYNFGVRKQSFGHNFARAELVSSDKDEYMRGILGQV
jgi:hypothetical protein